MDLNKVWTKTNKNGKIINLIIDLFFYLESNITRGVLGNNYR